MGRSFGRRPRAASAARCGEVRARRRGEEVGEERATGEASPSNTIRRRRQTRPGAGRGYNLGYTASPSFHNFLFRVELFAEFDFSREVDLRAFLGFGVDFGEQALGFA